LQVTWLQWVRQGSPSISENNTMSQVSTTRNNGLIAVGSTRSPTKSRSPATGDVVAVLHETPAAGWYARVRDGEQPQASSASQRPSNSASSRSPGRSSRSDQLVSRQQPPDSARQVVLEWTSSPATSRPPSPTPPSKQQTTGPGSTRTGSTYLVSPQELRGTILR